jgi:hypothetical protein
MKAGRNPFPLCSELNRVFSDFASQGASVRLIDPIEAKKEIEQNEKCRPAVCLQVEARATET